MTVKEREERESVTDSVGDMSEGGEREREKKIEGEREKRRQTEG